MPNLEIVLTPGFPASAAGRGAYFELSNEVSNFAFGVAGQALNEGIASNLSSDKYTNNLLRYAEKSTWMHKLVTAAFADDPGGSFAWSARRTTTLGPPNRS